MADIMRKGQKEILFSNGRLDEKTSFVLDVGDLYNADQFVAALRAHEFKHEDLDLYFAQGNKDGNNIIWEISDQHSNVTFEFFSLDDRPDLADALRARNMDILTKLQDFYDGKKCQNSKNKKLAEVLGKILKKKSELKLYAGFDPQKKVYFPVVIAWAGSFKYNDTNKNGILTGIDPIPAGDSLQSVGRGPDIIPIKTFYKSKSFWGLFILWLLIFVLALIIAFKLIPSCGLGKYFSNCGVTSVSTNARELYFDNLSKQLTIKNNLCLSPIVKVETSMPPEEIEVLPPEEIEVPEITTSTTPEIDERLEELDANRSELMVSLIWNTKEDLDLSITCPSGGTVKHSNKTKQQNNCGDLDVDANVNRKGVIITDHPIEHILLKPSSGTFEIEVKSRKGAFSIKNGSPTSFFIEVNDFGKITKFDGKLKPGSNTKFTLVRQ